MRSQETPYQMKRLRRVLETQQHVGEHAQRPLPHNGVQQSTENLWVKEIIVKIHLYKPKRCLGHLMKYSLKLKVNGSKWSFFFAFLRDGCNLCVGLRFKISQDQWLPLQTSSILSRVTSMRMVNF